MLARVGDDEAARARAQGNELYRAGRLSEAEKAYRTAASLAPWDPSPVSNMSAVRYEMGDYEGAIAHIEEAISLTGHEYATIHKKDNLYSRLAKCFLYLLDFSSAEYAICSIDNCHTRDALSESIGSTKALWADIPDESVLRKAFLEQFSQYKPSLQDIPEYYAVGHDQVEVVMEPLAMAGTNTSEGSFFFAGSGDGRNVFSAIAVMACKEAKIRSSSAGILHFTVLDLKPAALARMLIFFAMMVRVDIEPSEGNPHVNDYFLTMAYLFSCQIIPPSVEDELQSCIRELIDRLEGNSAVLPFVYVPKQDRKSLVRILHQWQHPWDRMSRVSEIRRFVRQKNLEIELRRAFYFGECVQHGARQEREDFQVFSTLFPPATFAKRREPFFLGLLAEYRSTGKSKQLLQYIDTKWRINNTLFDHDFANRSWEEGDKQSLPLDFHPLEVVESMGLLTPASTVDTSSIQKLADVFRAFSISTTALNLRNRLVVEVIVGEMTDTMERIRFNLLEHRLSPPDDGCRIDPRSFPRAFDYIHMSNIPDYIGGHLTTFLVARPLLREDVPSSLRFNNLLNPPEFENHQAFQSEYLLMHDMHSIERHFLLTRRPGEVTKEDLPAMLGVLRQPFAFEGYMVWDRISKPPMSFRQLLPRTELERWLYGHLLKICIPYPRPIFSGQPVYAPLNLTALLRLITSMFEVGYPAHWLVRILTCICSGTITTTARAPTKRVCAAAIVDATNSLQQFSILPWVADFTTLLSIWRRLLPFGTESPSGSLPSLASIRHYCITFPPFPANHERVPHFVLVFWNTEVGQAARPPDSIYNLLLDGAGASASLSTKDIFTRGLVCLTTFRYTTASRTAEFWLRTDTVDEMMAGTWRAFIWRTDTWTPVTDGVDLSSGVVRGRKWTDSLVESTTC